MDFNTLIINWYRQNRRNLPWRDNKNPYSIWLSEVILQQTQVVQGLPYYNNFIKNYPTVIDLANASEDEVLKLWQGLGYYSRARNLHAAAKYVAFDCEGIFPPSYKELLRMKGVGDYTASAIASIAYNEAVPTVDGNVLRVISRVFDVDKPVDIDAGRKEIKHLMNQVLDIKFPGDFNQAVMELGAMVCKPKNPNCTECPVLEKCLAHQNKSIEDRPVKTKKVKVSEQFVDYVFIEDAQGIVLLQRDASSIWKNLFEFPNVISDTVFPDLKHLNVLLKDYTGVELPLVLQKEMLHKLTHKKMFIRFFKASTDKAVLKTFIEIDKLSEKAVPKPIEQYLNEFVFNKA